jgi:hypothetical protein
MMNAFPRPAWNRCVLLLVVLAFGIGSVYAQEKSVRPGINKQYENPNINDEIRILESEKSITALSSSRAQSFSATGSPKSKPAS